jgi:DNA-binding CsgD family transcriptional regulator/cell division protein FtsB
LLAILNPSSIKYAVYLAQKNIYLAKTDTALKSMLGLMKAAKEKNPDYAMITYLTGEIYGLKKDVELQKKYYAISATADIKNAIKDNAAIQSLALLYFETGNIDEAYQYTRSALEDAIFGQVKFRTSHMSELYSIINTTYQEKEASRKRQLQFYLLLISLLSVFLIIAVIYVYQQMRKVAVIQKKLAETNAKLVTLNNDISGTNRQLKEMNIQLSESNHIKEEYIAHFFDLCSAYINKLEDYRKTLYNKAVGKQTDELFRILKSTTIVKDELDELYKNFDRIFLNLYPTFIKDFNSLLIPEEQVLPKHGELLNTELRIFALIRLGITDSVKIAAFLRYSISTIYNYRTKARNKAAVSREEFEIRLIKIGQLTANPQ